jgi:hypothetical protein
MVVMKEGVKESSLNLSRQHDFPTPESPISNSLICVNAVSLCVLAQCRGGTYQEVIITRPGHFKVSRAEVDEDCAFADV